MMKIGNLIFGYNNYAIQIAKNIQSKYDNLLIFKFESDEVRTELEEFDIEIFDLSDEWNELKEIYNMQKSIAFCVLEDDAQNIFLTISLRAEFPDLTIIALSRNKESANKISMAGANKVIPLIQTTASIIVDMLDKPIVTDALHSILYEENDLKVAEIEIQQHSYFEGKYPSDVEWSNEHGIIVLSVIDKEGHSEFIYSSKAKHHTIQNGDVFVVIGYEKDIEKFEKLIGGIVCQ